MYMYMIILYMNVMHMIAFDIIIIYMYMFGFEIIDMPIISMYMYMTFVDMFHLYTLVFYKSTMMCFVWCGSPRGMSHDALITWLLYHMFIHEVIF